MKVYMVCGVSGSGKSWVCNQLAAHVKYVPVDKMGHILPTEELELHDRVIKISTTIKKWRLLGIEVVPVFILGDFLKVKKQLVGRGGRITKSLYSRWKRMVSLERKYSAFTGDSAEVLKWLRAELEINGRCK